MKIGIVTESYYPAVGGIPEHVFNFAGALRQRGHQVKIITTSYGEYADAPFNNENVIRLGRAFNFQKNGSQAHIAYGRKLGQSLREIFKLEKFEILHIHGPEQPVLPWLALLNSNTVNVGTFHATYDRSLPLGFFRPWSAWAVSKLHARIAVSQTAKASIARYFPGEDYYIVPNGIDVDRFARAKPLEVFQNRPNILFVGNFVLRKGFVNLLEAFSLVKKAIPAVRLVAVGDGVLKKHYENKLADQIGQDIIFTGRVSVAELPNYYASAQVYCTPATGRESFGIVNLEAMAAGAPIVASNIPGYNCVLAGTGAAIQVNPNDIRALANALLQVLQNPELARQMSQAGRRIVEKYRWSKVAEQVEGVYAQARARQPLTVPVTPGYLWFAKLFGQRRKLRALADE
jgi:phosphatidylinositol alpha-mannosyltransferase